MNKTCSKCRVEKPTGEFHQNRDSPGGLHSYCRTCKSEVASEYRAANVDAVRAQQRTSQARYHAKMGTEYIRLQAKRNRRLNPISALLSNAKFRAKKRGIEFSLTREDIVLPTHCPVLGILLRPGQSQQDSHAYSLDRIDNSRGYVPGNVAVISLRANTLKSDATPEESEKIARYQAEHADPLGLKSWQ